MDENVVRGIVLTALQYCGPVGFSTTELGSLIKESIEKSSAEKKNGVDSNECKSALLNVKINTSSDEIIQSLFNKIR